MSDSDVDNNEFENTNNKDAAKKLKAKTYDDETEIVYDEILSQLFEKVPPGEGDEFAAVKPWLGAIKKPANMKEKGNTTSSPAENLEIDWVYGYRSEEARQNLFFNEIGQAVYPTAALGVIYDYKQQKQTYFGGGKTDFEGRRQNNNEKTGHNDDVTALCVSFDRKIVASGQNGQKPIIYIWDAMTGEIISKKALPKGSRLVTAIGISANNKYVVASDAAEKVGAYIFDIAGGSAPIADVTINAVVTHLACHPTDVNKFATAGKKHVAFCTFDGQKAVKKEQGKGINCNMCSVAFSTQAGVSYAGGADGQIYQFTGDKIAKQYPNNKGSVHTIACKDSGKGEVVLVGGSNKTLSSYSVGQGGALTKQWESEVQSPPRSIDLYQGTLLIGYKNGSIADKSFTADGQSQERFVMFSHCDGETWGLDICELEDGSQRLLTTADDNRVLAYNPQTKQVLAEGQINPKPKAKKEKGGYRGGASSMSSQPAECQSRCIAYSAALGIFAVADNKGAVTIREINWQEVDQGQAGSLDRVKKTLFKKLKKAEWIETMVFSPDSKWLAIGSHDNFIYVLSTKTFDEKKMVKLTGHSSFITCLDWSLDSQWLRSNCGAYELLFFNM